MYIQYIFMKPNICLKIVIPLTPDSKLPEA